MPPPPLLLLLLAAAAAASPSVKFMTMPRLRPMRTA
jgi:hypothetical protein